MNEDEDGSKSSKATHLLQPGSTSSPSWHRLYFFVGRLYLRTFRPLVLPPGVAPRLNPPAAAAAGAGAGTPNAGVAAAAAPNVGAAAEAACGHGGVHLF